MGWRCCQTNFQEIPMSTLDQLQAMLMQPAIEIAPGLSFKNVLPAMVCADGTTLSVQASENHYCSPRDDIGPYTEVEVWNVSVAEVPDFEYSSEDPSAYVDINSVVAFIDRHGGLAQ
jgi:hypothetical protein